MTFDPRPTPITGLYQRLGPFTSIGTLQAAALVLTAALRSSMTETSLYNIPADQCLPAEHPTDAAAVLVHPHNIAAALVGVSAAGAQFGAPLPIDPALMVYSPAGWVGLSTVQGFPTVPVQVEIPPPAPAAVMAPPPAPVAAAPSAPPPAPVAPPAAPQAPVASQQDISALVDAAMASAPITAPAPTADPAPAQVDAATLAAPAAVAANPVQPAPVAVAEPITTPEQYAAYRAAQGHGPAVIDGATGQVDPATPAPPPGLSALAETVPQQRGPQQLTPEQIKGPPLDQRQTTAAPRGPVIVPVTMDVHRAIELYGAHGEGWVYEENAPQVAPEQKLAAAGLPDASVLAERLNPETGRTGQSPFGRKVEPRNKIAANPWWWEFFLYSAPKLLAVNPASALDPGSTGSGPVQAYAALVELQLLVLDGADANLTVAQLRTWLREVQTGYSSLESSAAINQLADHMFRGDK